MSTATGPLDSSQLASGRSPAFALIRVAYLVNLTYLVWFWVTFAAGYWVYSWFDLEPGVDSLPDAGVGGWIALFGWALVASLPSWFGTRFAVRAGRAGGGKVATIALILNLVVVVGFFSWILLGG
jgi:hypothetical protein